MKYDEFKSKWLYHSLYDEGLKHTLSGKIDTTNTSIFLFTEWVNADLFFIPTWHGFKDDKQRRQFYKDAKSAGVRRLPKKKNVWYKRTYIEL